MFRGGAHDPVGLDGMKAHGLCVALAEAMLPGLDE
jgi:hypothetical protein